MIWIAPSEKDTANAELEKRLWDASASTSGLKSQECHQVRSANGVFKREEPAEVRMTKSERRAEAMSEELKKRTKKFALDVIGCCSGLPQTARVGND